MSYYNNMRKIMCGASLALQMMNAHYGNGYEFTKKEYERICKHSGASMLQTLRDNGFVSVTRQDKFEMPLKHPIPQEAAMFAKNGDKIMTVYEWRRLPAIAREAIEAVNGAPLSEREDLQTTFEAVRNYYTFNEGAIRKYCSDKSYLVREDTRRLLNKAKKQVARYEALLETLSDF